MAKTTRRLFLGFLGLVGGGGLISWFNKNNLIRWMLRRTDNEGLNLSLAPQLTDDFCVLTSSQVEGPFFIASPLRSDIREDRVGRNLGLNIQLVAMPDCQPIEGALIEIWHCDATGIYSGYPEDLAHNPWKTLMLTGTGGEPVAPLNEARFLRGAQRSDTEGLVVFQTIVPGWYEPRAPHIHLKALLGDRELLTTQFYFQPEFCRETYLGEEPYKAYGDSPYSPQNDIAVSSALQADGLVLRPRQVAGNEWIAHAKVGVRRIT